MKAWKISILSVLFLFVVVSVKAQFIEDALRYGEPNGLITSRSAGLGISYLGIADDYAALYFNPAGLSLITKFELSLGMGFQRNSNEVKFEQKSSNFSANDAYFSHIGFVAPFQTKLGNAAIGLGYFLENNYNNTYQYSGFNPRNTMTAYQAKYGTRNYEDNWAYHIWLANQDLKTPIVDSLTQSAFVKENGGLHDLMGGVAFDVGSSVSIGANIIGKFGTYNYSRNYSETDTYNKYNQFDTLTWNNLDFNTLFVDETIKQDVSGITGSIGMQARISEFFRFGATIYFPTFLHISEDFSIYSKSRFDDGWEPNPYDPAAPSQISYNIVTPFVYSAGLSFHTQGITITTGVRYLDATQLTFSDAGGDEVTNINDIHRYFEQLNRTIVSDLIGQVTWGIGVEWDLPVVPVVLRGSYQSTTSPYSNDVPDATNIYYSLGAGIYFANNMRLDAVFAWNKMNRIRTNYGSGDYASLYQLRTNPLNIGLQYSIRF